MTMHTSIPITEADTEKARGVYAELGRGAPTDIRTIAAALASARAEEREECAQLCIRIWREASNERTDSALTSYWQTAISHGCIASADAIRARTP